eukprot:CAMPEP_0168546566 /NCGR_PEP_ID=MMETSP0413-20121227/3567_1 /TAXON_ID=136452 /ORGANISM="Filamoeba nolandi, Strain NC-AS-23-1" /LENGTH=577 /DNA_ID=CAMNT_0008576753 /DNA_START=15 /DNA_END=1745 /DNA_ORIENTATION=+
MAWYLQGEEELNMDMEYDVEAQQLKEKSNLPSRFQSQIRNYTTSQNNTSNSPTTKDNTNFFYRNQDDTKVNSQQQVNQHHVDLSVDKDQHDINPLHAFGMSNSSLRLQQDYFSRTPTTPVDMALSMEDETEQQLFDLELNDSDESHSPTSLSGAGPRSPRDYSSPGRNQVSRSAWEQQPLSAPFSNVHPISYSPSSIPHFNSYPADIPPIPKAVAVNIDVQAPSVTGFQTKTETNNNNNTQMEISTTPAHNNTIIKGLVGSPFAPVKPRAISSAAQNLPLDLTDADRKVLSKFLQSHQCYGLIPESSKMVVLDISLAVRMAFIALEENGIKSAPLWDSKKKDYVGMITVTDFIKILLHYHKMPKVNIFDELQHHQIRTWQQIIGQADTPLISCSVDDTLYSASQLLLKHRIHRVPIMDKDTNTILHIATHYRILSFVMQKMEDRPKIFSCSVESLGIGTYKNVVTVLGDTPLAVVLRLLSEGGISAVPIVDENGYVIDVYSKSDVTALVKQPTFDFLDKPVGTILAYKKKEHIFTCFKSENLEQICDRLVSSRVHRLICVDHTNRVEGIISLSDILH